MCSALRRVIVQIGGHSPYYLSPWTRRHSSGGSWWRTFGNYPPWMTYWADQSGNGEHLAVVRARKELFVLARGAGGAYSRAKELCAISAVRRECRGRDGHGR